MKGKTNSVSEVLLHHDPQGQLQCSSPKILQVSGTLLERWTALFQKIFYHLFWWFASFSYLSKHSMNTLCPVFSLFLHFFFLFCQSSISNTKVMDMAIHRPTSPTSIHFFWFSFAVTLKFNCLHFKHIWMFKNLIYSVCGVSDKTGINDQKQNRWQIQS